MIRVNPVAPRFQRVAARAALALGLGGLAVAGAHGWAQGRAAARDDRSASTVAVLVTALAIAAGATLEASDLRWQDWPVDAVDRVWLTRGSGPSLVGRIVPAALPAGFPLTAGVAVTVGTGSGFAAAIQPGWRAISIAVTPAAGLAGFIAPGDRVDVLLTQTLGARRTVQTLLADLAVLGIDQQQRSDAAITAPIAAAGDAVADAVARAGAGPPNLVTLQVRPRQAEALAVAAELGKLSLALRGPGAEAVGAGSRQWDSDVTGLSAALLGAGANNSAVPAPSPNAVAAATSAAARPASGIEIVYGAAPSAPPAGAK